MDTIIYIYEPVLNSELILINNSKLLKQDPSLLNEQHLQDIEKLRKDFIKLEIQTEQGEIGLQKEKREVRDQIRSLSSKTYTNINTNTFGEMIILIINRIASRPQFSNYTFIDEMKSLATEHILLYTYKFDPFRQSKISGQYASAFAYISTIVFHAFVATINKYHKEQEKAKSDFLETQKLIHREPNKSTWLPDYEVIKRRINLPSLMSIENELLKIMKTTTINESTEFFIPTDYKISKKEQDFVQKYEYNISIRRIDPKEPKEVK